MPALGIYEVAVQNAFCTKLEGKFFGFYFSIAKKSQSYYVKNVKKEKKKDKGEKKHINVLYLSGKSIFFLL